ncbi:MAG: two-component system, LytTR family, sensor kinase [Acidobacteriota bacterium]|jgi:signal transduction histidine kinase|nr:two-component system, LytTR family, sensor kinase [Acidobacteriota bacterium]
MKDGNPERRGLLKWSLIAVAWALFGLFFASEVIIIRAYEGRPMRLGETLASWMICACVWLGLTPFILYFARRFPLERRRWLKNTLLQLAASIAFALLGLATYVLLALLVGLYSGQQPFFESFRSQFITGFHFELLTCWAVIGLHHALDYYRKYRERELRAAQLETNLAQAQLDALRMQLHPHFLFNTLNSISVLMAEDVRQARRMLTRLSDLLRASLENKGAHEVSLKEELEFLESYLEIEQTRFQDRLTVRMEIDPKALDARVPNLILQPLVENAIRHGIAPRAAAGLVEIRARRENGMVQLEVSDNGAGLSASSQESLMKGIGLSNTRARLEQLYGAAHRFELHNGEGRGLTVTIAIPFRREIDENGRSAK